MTLLLALLPGVPALTALAALSSRLPERAVVAGVMVTVLIGATLAVFGATPLDMEWLLLGTALGLDPLSRALLAAAVALWGAAALAARHLFADATRGPRFAICFLLTLSGNLGVIVALDAASFYLAFAVMTFAAYGLVTHNETDEARRAGRIYLILAIFGEGLLLAGLFLLAARVGNPHTDAIVSAYGYLDQPALVGSLLLAGFAVKMGVVPLHVWLPLAHPAAPVPASAVLSGIIVKAGLLGWLRFVPAGLPELATPGNALVIAGIAGAFGAALVGCFQARAKTVLAYSTVSQMGLLAILVGLLVAGHVPPAVAIPAITVFAIHHALAKGALFLAMDHLKAVGRRAGLITLLPVLAIIGAPMTSGLIAKAALKGVAPDPLPLIITLTSVTTTLLLLRFLALAWPRGQVPKGAMAADALLAWVGLITLGLVLPWLVAAPGHLAYAFQTGSLMDAVWPGVSGLAIAVAAARWWADRPVLPEGDLVIPAEQASATVAGWAVRAMQSARPPSMPTIQQRIRDITPRRLSAEPDIVWTGVALLALLLALPWFMLSYG